MPDTRSVTVPEDLYNKIKEEAEAEDRPVQRQLVRILRDHFAPPAQTAFPS